MKKVLKICGIVVAAPVAFIIAILIQLVIVYIFLGALTLAFDWDKYGVQTTLWFSDSKSAYSSGGFQDYTDYSEYHFNDRTIEKFKDSKWYTQVTDEDVDYIKSYFENFERWLDHCWYADNYSFDKDEQINAGDYFRIYNRYDAEEKKYYNYDVYYVDLETNTVYFIHNNI